MLRIHFTADDLARTRVAADAEPMWETVLSAQLLQNREGGVPFREWRRYARGQVRGWARPIATLAPHAAYFPDFLTPSRGHTSIEEDIDAVLSTPSARLREELGILAGGHRLPSWCRDLADGDPATLERFGGALRSYHEALVRPFWPAVQAHVRAERARMSRIFLDHGCEGVLSSLGPAFRWRAPVLETAYPEERDLLLEGTGLLLIPSYFCWRAPVTLVDPGLPPVLVYPVEHEPGGALPSRPSGRSLGAVLGVTRAAVLRAVEDGCTTTELARRSGASVSSASQHAAVLRDAGLIVTRRQGGCVLHSLTPVGVALLAGPAAA